MSELSIKVSIAGRIYPITVLPQEEDKVRAAAQKVEENLKLLQNSYAVKDKQDLLAMTALQLATELSAGPAKGQVVIDEAALKAIENLVHNL